MSKSDNKEFDLIREVVLNRFTSTRDVLVPNGDDGAVVSFGENKLCLSTDSFYENTHFSFEIGSYSDIGWKSVEASVSDLIAMGSTPKYILLSLAGGAEQLSPSNLKLFFNGVSESLSRLNITLIGGDTCSSSQFSVTATVLGSFPNNTTPIKRSGASTGDYLYVTGVLGGSSGGLNALKRKIEGFKRIKSRYLRPECRYDLLDVINKYATSAIDISDGLASELYHIARESNVGIEVNKGSIPLHPELYELCKLIDIDPYETAFSGGEDFEILFTSKEIINSDKVVKIGKIIDQKGVFLVDDKRRSLLKSKGYSHI